MSLSEELVLRFPKLIGGKKLYLHFFDKEFEMRSKQHGRQRILLREFMADGVAVGNLSDLTAHTTAHFEQQQRYFASSRQSNNLFFFSYCPTQALSILLPWESSKKLTGFA